MGKRHRSRNVCFTGWTDTIEFDKEYMKYLVFGRETCPDTGKKHLQGYVEFLRAMDFGKIVDLLGGEGVHIETRKGSPRQASDYCKKEKDFEEFGELSKQGKRSDLDEVVEHLENGLTVRETALANPIQYIKYHRGIEKLRSFMIKPRDFVPEVTVMYGKTGTGKSRKAREGVEDYYVWTPARGKWWDGYDGQTTVIMEEFRGQLPLGYMLTLLDRYECPVECKGGSIEFVAKNIIITSPKHPRDWYEDQSNDKIDQLLRRVTHVTEVVG